MPPKSYVHILPPGNYECDIIWKKDFCKCKFRILRRDHPTNRMACHPTAGILCLGEGGERLRGRRPVRMEAGPAGMRPLAKAGLEPPGAPRSREREGRPQNLRRERGPPDALVSDFSPQNRERVNFCCLKPSVGGHFSRQPPGAKAARWRGPAAPMQTGPTRSRQPDQTRALNGRRESVHR